LYFSPCCPGWRNESEDVVVTHGDGSVIMANGSAPQRDTMEEWQRATAANAMEEWSAPQPQRPGSNPPELIFCG